MQHVAGVMDSASVDSAIDEAASKLGYSHVKPEQREAIRALASGQDARTGCLRCITKRIW